MPILPRFVKAVDLTLLALLRASIALLGDKAKAKATAKNAGCPVIPGSDGIVADVKQAFMKLKNLGFQFLLKLLQAAVAKGFVLHIMKKSLISSFVAARAEAEAILAILMSILKK